MTANYHDEQTDEVGNSLTFESDASLGNFSWHS